jgi:hypothetical protein
MMVVLLLIGMVLSGCAASQVDSHSSSTFYYLQREYLYGNDGSVIAPEAKGTSESRSDIQYLMALYAMGPTVEEHIMPYPSETRITCSESENGDVILSLSDAASGLSDSEFTLASTCLAMTCFEAADCTRVTVQLGDRSITMTRSSIVLKDNRADYLPLEETQ